MRLGIRYIAFAPRRLVQLVQLLCRAHWSVALSNVGAYAPPPEGWAISSNSCDVRTGASSCPTLTHVRIRLPLGKELLLPRTDVKGMRSGGKSIMPEGLEAGLTPQQMADLLAFITGL